MVPEARNAKAMTDRELAATSPDEAASLIEVMLEPQGLGHRFFLVGATGPESMAPAWCMRTTATVDDVPLDKSGSSDSHRGGFIWGSPSQ